MAKITAYDVDILARTIYGEARSEGQPEVGRLEPEQVAVGLVIRRRWRARRCAGSIASICQAPAQFSAWNMDDPNRARMERVDLSDPHFRECTIAALAALDASDAQEAELTQFADHYMTRAVFERDPPAWVRGKTPCAELGAHVFFNDINGPAPVLPEPAAAASDA